MRFAQKVNESTISKVSVASSDIFGELSEFLSVGIYIYIPARSF
jgi:hypothetical protein